jgi:hypothetical protein
MKVKVGAKIYDSEKEPVMVILSDGDKKNIENMFPECTKFCSYPDSISNDDIIKWMKDD